MLGLPHVPNLELTASYPEILLDGNTSDFVQLNEDLDRLYGNWAGGGVLKVEGLYFDTFNLPFWIKWAAFGIEAPKVITSQIAVTVGSTNDIDDDGYTENEGDCNDHNPDIHPGGRNRFLLNHAV